MNNKSIRNEPFFEEVYVKEEVEKFYVNEDSAPVDESHKDTKNLDSANTDYSEDAKNNKQEAFFEEVYVKKEVEESDVDEDLSEVDESLTVVKHEVDNCLSESVEVVQPENTVLESSKDPEKILFRCQVCSKSFKRKVQLDRHTLIHSNERPFKCTVCSRGFNDISTLKKHVKMKVCLQPRLHTPDFTCKHCNKSYKYQSLLKNHLNSHEKPYRCEICDHHFGQKAQLQIHLRRHTGERPYVCTVCSKGFYMNFDLTVHMRTHSDERPYTCSVCDKSFTSKPYLDNTHAVILTSQLNARCAGRSSSQ